MSGICSHIRSVLHCTACTLLVAALFIGLPGYACAADPVKIKVEGVDGAALKNVTAALALPSGMVRDGTVDKHWLERFCENSEALAGEALQAYGYYGARVKSSLGGDDEKGYLLTVTVIPGEPTRIGSILVETSGPGAGESSLQASVADFPLKKDDILLHETYEKAKSEMLAAARGLGYLDADFSTHRIEVDPATASASISLNLATGPRYLFGETTIESSTIYPEGLLRRYISFKKGDPFSYKALGKTQLNLSSSPYFKTVSVIPRKEQTENGLVPVSITMTPAAQRTIRPGAGFGTDTGVRASVGYKDLNLFSPGHVFSADATLAQKLQGISLGYSIPSHSNLETVTSFQYNWQREDVNDIVTQLMALEVNRTKGLGQNLLGTAFFRILHEQNFSTLEHTDSFLLLPGLRLSRLNYNDLINPTQGYHLTLEVRGTSRAFGSDSEFLQFVAGGAHILPLPWKFSLRTRLNGGTTVLDGATIQLPSSLRFFAGGDNSVRGYGYKTIGPRDASGEVVGGKKLLQGSLELERALFGDWSTSIFYDAGDAFNSSSEFKLYQGAGLGLHYRTMIGTVNLDLARQLGVARPGYKLHFTIGFQL